MANGKIRFGKQSGGQLALVIPDGVANTEVIIPESGTVASTDGATVDNTIPRYDGVSGKLQSSSVTISDSGNMTVPGGILSTGLVGIGYGTGAGGTVTQLTSKSTDVTLNKPSGEVLTHNAALAAGASVVFIINNSLVGTYDTSIAVTRNGNYDAKTTITTNGVIYVKITNVSGSSLSDSVPINFTVLKGANS